ncbi:MAG: DUF5132 domain-containing protein [Methylocystis sp.]
MYSVHENDMQTDAENLDHVDDGATEEMTADSTMLATVATIGMVGVGVAVIEAALLPGVVLGVAAVAAPKYLPRVGSALAPLFRSAIRGVYITGRKTRELVAEAQEQVNDIVAEIDSEDHLDVETADHAETRKS